MQSFLLSLRRDRRKEIDVFRFSPSNLPYTGAVRLDLCENIKPVQDRISTTLHESTPMSKPEFRLMLWKTFFPPPMNFVHTWFITLQAFCWQSQHNDAFHMSATKVFVVCLFVSSTYLTSSIRISSSLFSREEMFKFGRISMLIWCQCRDLFKLTNAMSYLFNIEKY